MPTGWYIVQPPSSGLLRAPQKPVKVGLTGALLYDGSIAPIQLNKVSITMAGQVPLTGPMNIALKKLVFSLVGEEKTFGGLAVTLKKVQPDLQQELITGALSSRLKPIRLDMAEATLSGVVGTTLKPVAALMGAQQEFPGQLGVRLAYAQHLINARELKVRQQKVFANQAVFRSSTR